MLARPGGVTLRALPYLHRVSVTMIRLALPLLLLFASSSAHAQEITVPRTIEAATDDGRIALLHPDGTWSWKDGTPLPPAPPAPPAPPPPAPPTRSAEPPPPGAPPRTLSGSMGTYTLRYDASRWSRAREVLNAEAEYQLALPFGAGYAITIFEVTPYPLDVMRDLVLENASSSGTVELLREDDVEVEGGAVRRVEFEVVTDVGLAVTFINSFHSSEEGTLQVVTWTSTAVYDRFRDELLRFHDGLTLLSAEE